jgi:hypothetical protein
LQVAGIQVANFSFTFAATSLLDIQVLARILVIRVLPPQASPTAKKPFFHKTSGWIHGISINIAPSCFPHPSKTAR